MKIYTKTGDEGKTSLFRGGRVSKDHDRIEAYGSVDELNSILGIVLTETKNAEVSEVLIKIQNDLFVVGSDLATVKVNTSENDSKILRSSHEMINYLEKKIDYFDDKLPSLTNFILPGGSKSAAYLHLARTVCRRAERKVVRLMNSVDISNEVMIYLNRLSDFLFVLSRFENFQANIPDTIWNP
ncbi:MAG: ATP:cob(I)alamin adenosyltransferase [Ignavibacteriales bacterium CG_4_9_14_3_um_filter_34_10]|nr:MAG: ATP:cob(I)alamin adenosyltransferase [Ignavibacteriales bacterium CG_4_9_14_3_um_filter_34_10]